MKHINWLAALFVLLPAWAGAGEKSDEMKPYPAAEQGSNRWVFNVPHAENELIDRPADIGEE